MKGVFSMHKLKPQGLETTKTKTNNLERTQNSREKKDSMTESLLSKQADVGSAKISSYSLSLGQLVPCRTVLTSIRLG
jgi:hypothetical protein